MPGPDVAVKARAEGQSEVHRPYRRLWIGAVDVEDRRVDHPRDVGRTA